jgi:hypothetical protein
MWENSPGVQQQVFTLDDDLKNLAPEDLGRVRRWVEDRFVNAVCPLMVQLRLSTPENEPFESTLQVAQVAVERVLAAVDEVRRMDSEMVF